MRKYEVCKRIVEAGIIPVVHADSPDAAVEICRAICAGGIPVIELTMTVPGAVEVIAELKRTMKDVLIGAGTVLDARNANLCIDAGAEFIVSPGFDAATAEAGTSRSVLMIPGALTPTEVIRAWHHGFEFVKIFPCGSVGGPSYIKSLKAALPQIQMIPTGGVNLSNALAFFRAGAAAIGVGGELCSVESITETARHFAAIAKERKP
jgi:2-dehydro-3-deoxyphosphogluconate aldolase/(4S)-4-hydroxy-2-oxoglutarate aldolase